MSQFIQSQLKKKVQKKAPELFFDPIPRPEHARDNGRK